jgi:uncharacterized membrane protein
VTFANPLPWWGLALVVSAAAALAWHTYRHLPAAPARRLTLTALRFVIFLAIVLFLMRPVSHAYDPASRDAVVAILVDTSRSMAIKDAGSVRRIDRARQLVREQLLPNLGDRFRVEVLGFGESVEPKPESQLAATARRSDLQSAIGAVRERYRGHLVAGIVLLSDGGDTSGGGDRAASDAGLAIYPIGIGSPSLSGDREVLSVTAAEAVLDDARLDLAVTAVGREADGTPIELRLLENGRPIDVVRVPSTKAGTAVHHVFRASPPRGAATVYTVDTPVSPDDPVPENNARSVLVQGPTRPRRILLVEGAPGFEHSFLKRAWTGDQGLEVDAVVRKGKDERGVSTFYVQAVRSRGDALVAGYPPAAEALFAYDAVVLANVDAAMLSPGQLETTRAFVSKRGGGLLVLGSASFGRRGLMGTALEDALPLQLSGRDGAALPASLSAGVNRVTLTPDGAAHPIMQLGEDSAATRKRWETIPAVAAVTAAGGARPGASVLAVTGSAGGTARALIAVQRYGLGRSMVFTGEASWRWRMQLPSADRTYETFWRQTARWLSMSAVDPVQITLPAAASAGDVVPIRIDVRSPAFDPVPDASVEVRVSAPDGRMDVVQSSAAPASGPGRAGSGATSADGRIQTTFTPSVAGVYRVTAEARRGGAALGSATAPMLVGGADPEMTDARVNAALLQRVALASGGRTFAENDLGALPDTLRSHLPVAALAATRDLWNTAWSFAAIVVLLAGEWVIRRRSGLR